MQTIHSQITLNTTSHCGAVVRPSCAQPGKLRLACSRLLQLGHSIHIQRSDGHHLILIQMGKHFNAQSLMGGV